MKLIQGRYKYADASDMYGHLGTRKLPPEGMPERVIDGVRVYVKPLPIGIPPRGRRFALRVMAICECGKHLAVGRMHQHKCKVSK